MNYLSADRRACVTKYLQRIDRKSWTHWSTPRRTWADMAKCFVGPLIILIVLAFIVTNINFLVINPFVRRM